MFSERECPMYRRFLKTESPLDKSTLCKIVRHTDFYYLYSFYFEFTEICSEDIFKGKQLGHLGFIVWQIQIYIIIDQHIRIIKPLWPIILKYGFYRNL